jgi:hypothetical protein
MASSQDTQPSKMNKREAILFCIKIFKYHFLLHILRYLFFVSDNIMADVTSKPQTTALFLSTRVTRTRRRTALTKILTNLTGNM